MSRLPNDDVRVQDHSTAVIKTKKDYDWKRMKNKSKKANMGKSKKNPYPGNGEELDPTRTGRNSKSTTQNSPRKRNISVKNSTTNY